MTKGGDRRGRFGNAATRRITPRASIDSTSVAGGGRDRQALRVADPRIPWHQPKTARFAPAGRAIFLQSAHDASPPDARA